MPHALHGPAKDDGSFEVIRAGVDPRQELQNILKGGGGIKLGYRLMKSALHDHVKIMWVAEKACWDWYTGEIEDTKTPTDALVYCWSMINDKWASEPHLWKTLWNTLFSPEYLEFMDIPMGPSQKATRALHLSWSIVAGRGWTLSKHSCPPDCHGQVLQRGNSAAVRAQRQQGADLMKTHHGNVLRLEAARHHVADGMTLWGDILFLEVPPIRLAWEHYRQDRYSPFSSLGTHLMIGLLMTMADNKSVEDVHLPLRLEAKGNSNKKLSKDTLQDIVVHSQAFENRVISHAAAVDKDVHTHTTLLITPTPFIENAWK